MTNLAVGICKIEPDLFTRYVFIPPEDEEYDDNDGPILQVSLESLLETLKIFGINDIKERSSRDPAYGGVSGSTRAGINSAFEPRILGMTGTCRLSWLGAGEPLCIVLEETGVTTTCELVTYAPELQSDFPFSNEHRVFKIITRATWLFDAINELSSTDPATLTIVASPAAPYFSLSSAGPHGSATVEFSKDPALLETFDVRERSVNTFKYSLIRHTTRAMGMATKVSMRCDEQGVLSAQFMIEVEEGKTSFVEYRLVAYVDPAEEGTEEEEYGGQDIVSTDEL
jgi:cell cycle checkpoint protein